MRIVRSLDSYEAGADLLLSIGVFDGVHIGHRSVLERLLAMRRAGALVGALTFEHHPQAFLQPDQAPKSLTTLDEKIDLLASVGIDILFLLPFDERIQRTSAHAFLEDVLLRRLRTRALIVGDQWRFGEGRSGDVALAQSVLTAHGCFFEAAPLLERDGERVSSSRIRELIAQMQFAEADTLLGSPYRVRGTVVLGDGRGHELGYPTANLDIEPEKLIPPPAVYATTAWHKGKAYPSVTSIGDKPTFGGSPLTTETYIPGFDATIYGDQLGLSHWRFIRKQQRFDGRGALIEQIALDVKQALE
ncbi:MAG: riboflavin biosynthesis protein RibF [Candidatus Eremiobacteraeota bacterium]|nr:riboflavin biosynthesis protein RibF [Candidatus Eremiobacteraeota bacterium]MBV8203464.1 riboflavin biosynthesis protein RibF [Candidatus Eremiobacteraeota bacterium]MBV8596485.1 riboflavin biosynthesis protein RibF [Candidatus Eremiobacteraeota bacterium]MBV8670260.1 riboflavin biosynthesis protein RibF [Candidatus Eremiobacteraeota bacterium]